MQIIIQQQTLNRLLSHVAGMIPSKPTDPMYAAVTIDAKDRQVTVTGTSPMYGTASAHDTGDVNEPGSVNVMFRMLMNLVKLLPDTDVMLTTSDRMLKVEAGAVRMRLPVTPIDDHMPIIVPGDVTWMRVPADRWRLAVTRAQSVASQADRSRPILTGIHLNARPGGTLTVESTDRYRLARTVIHPDTDTPMVDWDATCMPGGLSTPDTDPVDVTVTGRMLIVRTPVTLDGLLLVDGRYPDTDKVIPDQWASRLNVDRMALARSVERLLTVTDGSDVTLSMHVDDGTMRLGLSAGDNGEGTDRLDADTAGGTPTVLRANPRYVLDACRMFSGQLIRVEWTGSPTRPFRMSNPEDAGSTLLVTPKRVPGA